MVNAEDINEEITLPLIKAMTLILDDEALKKFVDSRIEKYLHDNGIKISKNSIKFEV
jgi:hypothetical protein